MCKTISHAGNACSFKYKLFCFKMDIREKNQHMKKILSKTGNIKQTTKTCLVNNKKKF